MRITKEMRKKAMKVLSQAPEKEKEQLIASGILESYEQVQYLVRVHDAFDDKPLKKHKPLSKKRVIDIFMGN